MPNRADKSPEGGSKVLTKKELTGSSAMTNGLKDGGGRLKWTNAGICPL